MAIEPDRDERLALDDARAALVERELAPLRAERLQRERDLIESLEIAPGYVAAFEALSGIDLRALAAECERFLRETESMWADVHGEAVRKQLGIRPTDATRADALALMRAPRFDPYFPAADMEPSVRRQVTEMGVRSGRRRPTSFTTSRRGRASGRGHSARRCAFRARFISCCFPHGGATDYRTLLHELGHALHFGYMRDDLPFEYRWLGDNSITEGYAMLFDHLTPRRRVAGPLLGVRQDPGGGVSPSGGVRGAAISSALRGEAGVRAAAVRRRHAVVIAA